MDKKLNVCLLNDSFPPLIDGVINTVVNYANIIQCKYGNAVVATPWYPNVKDIYTFPVHRYRSIDTTRIFGYRLGYPFSVSALKRMKAQDIDIIHSHCPVVSTLFARTLRESIDKPVIFTYHTKFNFDISKLIPTEGLQQRAIKAVVNNIEACDDVWVVSEGAGENLRSLGYAGDYIVMQNGVDLPQGRVSDEEILSVRRTHNLSQEVPTFLFVGRLMWYKGIRLLLDSLKSIKDDGFRFNMLFVGEGADREEIEEYTKQLGIEQYCIFAGAIRDRELLRAYYCAADLFAFPSTYDTNGIVVREAAACGLASLLIKGSCASEGIVDGQSGIFAEEKTESLSAALALACKDVKHLRELGQNAMNEIYVSWEDCVEKAYNRYCYVLENYQRGVYKNQPLKLDKFFTAMSDVCDVIAKARPSYREQKVSRREKRRIRKKEREIASKE